MTIDTFHDLEKWLEASAGASREIDGSLLRLDAAKWKAARQRAAEPCGAPETAIDRDAPMYAPYYTSSLDAAVAFAEAVFPRRSFIMFTGDPTRLDNTALAGASSQPYAADAVAGDYGRPYDRAATPALALCLAVIRALKERKS